MWLTRISEWINEHKNVITKPMLFAQLNLIKTVLAQFIVSVALIPVFLLNALNQKRLYHLTCSACDHFHLTLSKTDALGRKINFTEKTNASKSRNKPPHDAINSLSNETGKVMFWVKWSQNTIKHFCLLFQCKFTVMQLSGEL